MVKALMLSAAYSWFVGLLIVMIVVTALFALILFIALKPVNKENLGGGDADYAKKLLGRREAELTSQLIKNQNNLEEMEKLMAKLREVSSAQKLINELVTEERGPQDGTAPKAAKKSVLDYLKFGKKPVNKQAKPAIKGEQPKQVSRTEQKNPTVKNEQNKPVTQAEQSKSAKKSAQPPIAATKPKEQAKPVSNNDNQSSESKK